MRIRSLVLPAAGALLVTAASAGVAAAGTTVTQHGSFPATGATITCGPTVLTPTAGVIDVVFHENEDGAGRYHYAGTDTAHGVTLLDADGRSYRLEGASSFSGTSTDPEGLDDVVTTDVEKFTIARDHGGLLGMVDVVNHLSRNGRVTAFEFGSCSGIG
jgi:hypothetical protein